MKLKVFITADDWAVENIFKKEGHECVKKYTPDVDLAVFTGGEDITPFLYGEQTMRLTHPNVHRDMSEIRIFQSLPNQLPKAGICRGAQLLNALSGGRMWQHVDKHAGQDHDMKDTISGEIIKVTSVHHQMMIPASNAWILGVANESNMKINARESWNRRNVQDDAEDVEACYYANTNSFCIQSHPEYGVASNCEWFFHYIDYLFEGDIRKAREHRSKHTKGQEVVCG